MAESEGFFLICRVATRSVALPLAFVVEILRAPRLEGVGEAGVDAHGQRGVAPGLCGLAMLRGSLAPVVDLAAYLGMSHGQDRTGVPGSDSTRGGGSVARLVSVRLPDMRGNGASGPGARATRPAGLLVDEVTGVDRLDRATLERIELPGGALRTFGRFDAGLAECLDLAGFVLADVTADSAPDAEAAP